MKSMKTIWFGLLTLFLVVCAALAAQQSNARLDVPQVQEFLTRANVEQFTVIAGNQKVDLSWRDNNPGIRQYVLERDGAVIVRRSAGNTDKVFHIVDDHLSSEFQYNYHLYGIDANGERNALGAQSAAPNRVREVASEYSLDQNFPNPFNPQTQISFSVPEQSFVQLTIYNSLGQTSAVLVANELSAGRHSVNFDGTSYAAGIYLYELKAGPYHQVRKMVLVK